MQKNLVIAINLVPYIGYDRRPSLRKTHMKSNRVLKKITLLQNILPKEDLCLFFYLGRMRKAH